MRRFVRNTTLWCWIPLVWAAGGPEVGEWSVDAASCAESRMVFTADGYHEGRVRENGVWETVGRAPYRRTGNLIVITDEGQEERLEVLEETRDRLVLRNTDAARMQVIGIDRLELVRCPADRAVY